MRFPPVLRRGAVGLVIALALSLGCSRFFGSDPRAAGPNSSRWEATLARPRAAVFNVALQVLADSGYILAQSNPVVGAISTADRKVLTGARTTQSPEMGTPSDYPVRLSLVLTPQGADSTRLSISGEYRPGSGNSGAVTVSSSGWRFVSSIGEAILARVR